MHKLGFGVAVLVSALQAQSGDFRLLLPAPGPYHEREVVAVDLTGPGREWRFAGFLLEPSQECGTVAKPCTQASTKMQWDGSGLMSPSASQVLLINLYVPRFGPGHYRVKALARRMTTVANGNSSYSRDTEPPEYATTDAVEFDILPSTAAWVGQTIARCVATLKGAPPTNLEQNDAFRTAAQQLGLLDTLASREAALDAMPNCEGALLNGLRNTRDPANLCDRMQARVPLPSQSVSPQYMFALTSICTDAHLPAAPPPPPGGRLVVGAVLSATPPPQAAMPAVVDPVMQAWQDKYRAYTEDLWTRASAALAASLPQKQPEAKLQGFTTLLQRVNQARSERQSDPTWVPAMTAEFARFFPSMDVSRRQYLLDMFTSTIHGVEVIPLLESIMDSWKPGEYYQAVQSALRALNAIDPARAQARIRTEMVRPETWLDISQLDLLPPGAVPPMDDALIEALAVSLRPPGWNPNLRMAALARYGTPQALARMKAIYESQQPRACQPELVAYFVRVEPAYADRIFHSHPWDMHVMPPPCTVAYFERIPKLAMSPGLEEYLATYLMHGEVYVKTTAARSLGRYGTPTALPKLWDALRYFGEWWKGKGTELAKNGQGIALEVELRNSIARGRGWLASPADLRSLESQCVSDWCRSETQADLRWWDGPLRIELHDGQNRVAQYANLESTAELEAKLAQFPRGTRFMLSTTGKEADEIRRFAASHGFLVN